MTTEERLALVRTISEELRLMEADLYQWASGKWMAGRKARVRSAALGHALKNFREVSMEMEKKVRK